MTTRTTDNFRNRNQVPWRTLHRKRPSWLCWLPAFGLILAWTLLPALADPSPPLFAPEKIARIALDPGHGGRDAGARGPTGLLEKDACLEFARELALRLETHYQVTLTRSDDYQVELRQRTAIANQADADMLISLHTGAGYVHSTRGISIYYYQDIAGRLPADDTLPAADSDDRHLWDQTQAHHQSASLSLATALKKHLAQNPASPGCSIHGAPLAVLEGADMPAVLIEIGHITNPIAETRLGAPQAREWLTQAILNAIQDFLSEQIQSRGRRQGK